MTRADQKRFLVAFNRLAVACRLPAKDADAAMQKIYFHGLSDLPVDAVELAAGELEKSAQWFPKVSEWREAAKVQRTSLLHRALPPAREEPWREECEVCSDTGWERRTCYPGTPVNCGRKDCIKPRCERAEHSYVMVCSCRPTNRTYHRTHQYVSHGA